MKHFGVMVALCAMGTVAQAQVGHQPARSPFLDLEERHEVNVFVGQFLARKDPAGVAPRSGLMTGVQYLWRVGGPAHLMGEIGHIASERRLIDPAEPEDQRVIGDRSWPLYTADAALVMSLTGARSWHRLVPMVRGGLGFVSDFRNADAGGYRFGTRFALTFGGGVRWTSERNLQLRADLTDRIYTVAYPETYYRVTTPGIPAVLSAETAKSRWMHNPSISIGAAYVFNW